MHLFFPPPPPWPPVLSCSMQDWDNAPVYDYAEEDWEEGGNGGFEHGLLDQRPTPLDLENRRDLTKGDRVPVDDA